MAELSRELEREIDVVQLEKSDLKDKIMRDGMQWKKKSL
jgi:hypothetical protein